MLFKFLGLLAIVLVICSLPLSVTVGAYSIISFYLALTSVLVASLVTAIHGKNYYFPVLALASVNIMGTNDATNLFGLFNEQDWLYTLSMYGIFAIIVTVSTIFAKKDSVLLSSLK
ncbi:hypothetical protein ACFOEE_08710 [Pseudoalteromonas fenneropenaei]|uniref:Uncharacterized protein n=1 Tax=Pseudoalteromonas fenneropenaei TaxID=1737459 RepID=A0ABV7CJ60_9GAMM